MNFIEIENNIINVSQISSISKVLVYGEMKTKLIIEAHPSLFCDVCYYNKLKDLIKPTHLNNDKESIHC